MGPWLRGCYLLHVSIHCWPQCLCNLQASVAAVIVTGVGNRLLYKMALVPLENYVFFLAQLQTFGYVLVYFTVLAVRYRYGPAALPYLFGGTWLPC